ncbi:MAG: hypothetical protein DHS20C18_35070 [Saprospiraceae bacterium]|nr:MAG: hypothetical protein DHS20C18_35070 [Saprospiraceae bacterium]
MWQFTYSQVEFAPSGSKWTFDYENFPFAGIEEIDYVADTIVNGITVKKLQLSRRLIYSNGASDDTLIENGGVRYLYQDGDEILEYIAGVFHPIFRFSLEAGDSIQVPYNGTEDLFVEYDRIEVRVDSVSSLEINGLSRKLLFVNELCQTIDESTLEIYPILEGIGPIEEGYLFFNEWACNTAGAGHRFRCFQINGAVIYSTGQACDVLTAFESPTSKPEAMLEVFPNPAKDQLRINYQLLSGGNVQVYDVQGRLVHRESVAKNMDSTLIDVASWPKGLYILRYTDLISGARHIEKVIIE